MAETLLRDSELQNEVAARSPVLGSHGGIKFQIPTFGEGRDSEFPKRCPAPGVFHRPDFATLAFSFSLSDLLSGAFIT
jgi:hypothetical protein